MVTFKDLQKDSELLKAEIRIPKIIGKFFIWNYVPADGIFKDIDEIKGLPAETKETWKQEMRDFIEALESGVFTFSGFSDPWAPGYMLGYIPFDYYGQFAEKEAEQAMELFPSLLEEGQTSQSLALELADMIEVLTRAKGFIGSLPTSVSTGNPYKDNDGLIAMENIYTRSAR